MDLTHIKLKSHICSFIIAKHFDTSVSHIFVFSSLFLTHILYHIFHDLSIWQIAQSFSYLHGADWSFCTKRPGAGPRSASDYTADFLCGILQQARFIFLSIFLCFLRHSTNIAVSISTSSSPLCSSVKVGLLVRKRYTTSAEVCMLPDLDTKPYSWQKS